MTKILTLKELANFLNISERSIYSYIKADKIPYYKVGGQYRFNEEEIIKWLGQNREPEALEKVKTIENILEKRLYFVALLTKELKKKKIQPVLVGDNAVEFYTLGGYATADIDIIAPSRPIDDVLSKWNFVKEGRYWINEELEIQIEAPSDELSGDWKKVTKVMIDNLEAFVIGIEDIIVDRLNAYVHWQSAEDKTWATELIDINKDKIDWQYLEATSRRGKTYEALKKIIKELAIK